MDALSLLNSSCVKYVRSSLYSLPEEEPFEHIRSSHLLAKLVYLGSEQELLRPPFSDMLPSLTGKILVVSDASDLIPEALASIDGPDIIGVSSSGFFAAGSAVPDSSVSRGDAIFGRTWRALMAQPNTSAFSLRKTLESMPGFTGPLVRLAITTFDTSDFSNIPYAELVERYHELIPDSFITVHEGEIITLISYEQERFDYFFTQDTFDTLDSILIPLGARMGVSNGTEDYTHLPTLYSVAKDSATLAYTMNVQPAKRVFHTERFAMYLAIDSCYKQMLQTTGHGDMSAIMHPAVLALYRHDKLKKDNLIEVLFHYFRNDRNLVKTASFLYMHKNTVLNKLRKINQLVKIDFDSNMIRERIVFSIQILYYYKLVLKKELQ